MKKIKENSEEIIFECKINKSLINAIRKYILKIKTLAVDEVEFNKNDSALYDEMIAHRLGLVPLETPEKVDLKKIGTLKLKSFGEGYVYSKDLNGNAKVKYGEIPITFLKEGQCLDLEAFLKMGDGCEHTKFTPGILFYNEVYEIKSDFDLKTLCQHEIYLNLEKKSNGKFQYKGEACDSCQEVLEQEKKVSFSPSGEILVHLESFGQMNPKRIFLESVKKLVADLEEVSDLIK